MAVHIFLKFVDPPAHPPRAPCSSSTGALAWPKPDLSPPADFDGDGILALFVGPAGGGLTVDPTRSAALGGPRERRFVGTAAGPHGGAHAFRRPHGGPPSAHSPRAPCSCSTDALAWPKPDLSPPTDFDGDGILALFALAAGACREGKGGKVSYQGEEAV
jgi:hypothetical protein